MKASEKRAICRSYTDDQYERLGLRALRITRNPTTTCPWCLYELGSLLHGGASTACPECGELVSKRDNVVVWGKRGRRVRLYRFLTFGTGPLGLVTYIGCLFASPLAVVLALDGQSGLFNIMEVLFWSVQVLVPVIAFLACYRWQTLCQLNSPFTVRIALSTVAAVANLGLLITPLVMLFP